MQTSTPGPVSGSPTGPTSGQPPATWPEFWRDLARRVLRRAAARRAAERQPAWATPALLAVTALATWSYAWRATRPVNIEIYYAAAARSMSGGLSNFFFGAADPAGLLTTDKLPGAFWLQAICVGLFGAHRWALVLPQVAEGALTVLVLYRVIRRLAGPAAGLVAASVLALSPATAELNRGNVPDTLMILLAVLAADAVVSAARTGRRRPLLLAGLWIGLAFQAKMLEAWLLLPALAVCYLIAAPEATAVRLRRCAGLLAVAGVVSLSWLSLVTIWPAGSRPYIDGSTNNSEFGQVFVYNGLGRLDEVTPDQLVSKTLRLHLIISPPPSAGRLLTGDLGRDTGWLLAAAVIALAACLIARRREPRTDLMRAGLLLWGTWLVTLFAAFSAATTMNSYYTAALSPAVAALLGIGVSVAWQHREQPWCWLACGVAVATTGAYAIWLLPAAGTGLPAWLRTATAVVAAAALLGLGLAAAWRRRAAVSTAAGLALAVAAIMLVPATATLTVVGLGLGPFETPFEPARQTAQITQTAAAGFGVGTALSELEAANAVSPYLMATQTGVLAAPFIWASGREVVPVGGFTGTMPAPTLAQLQAMIRANLVHTFIQAANTTDHRLTWVARNCIDVTRRARAATLPLAVYYCPG